MGLFVLTVSLRFVTIWSCKCVDCSISNSYYISLENVHTLTFACVHPIHARTYVGLHKHDMLRWLTVAFGWGFPRHVLVCVKLAFHFSLVLSFFGPILEHPASLTDRVSQPTAAPVVSPPLQLWEHFHHAAGWDVASNLADWVEMGMTPLVSVDHTHTGYFCSGPVS